jgi:hypothetical protein
VLPRHGRGVQRVGRLRVGHGKVGSGLACVEGSFAVAMPSRLWSRWVSGVRSTGRAGRGRHVWIERTAPGRGRAGLADRVRQPWWKDAPWPLRCPCAPHVNTAGSILSVKKAKIVEQAAPRRSWPKSTVHLPPRVAGDCVSLSA